MAFNASLVTVDAFNVTPSDSEVISAFGFTSCDGGNVTVVTAKGTTVEFASVPAGFTTVLAIQKIKATGTSSSNLVAYGPT